MTGNNIERDLGSILQKLKDQDAWLAGIDKKVGFTNGKVANAIKDIALVKQKQEECPARVYHDSTSKASKYGIIFGIIMACVAIMQVVIAFKVGG